MVAVTLRTDGRGSTSMEELYRWLRGERSLTGLVRTVQEPPGEQDLGAGSSALEIAVGSSGVCVALVGSLNAWLQSRRSEVSIEVTAADKSVKVKASNVDEVTVLLTEAMRIAEGREP
ncbi:hypothetical protein ABH935_005848 [Catenulispora sp. GAS73]|uniref:effector-associated constant component EACC1 n=1 Tax=Catenulispora sp. GAS73 TaxID=3156269 RepID=UPI00351698E7